MKMFRSEIRRKEGKVKATGPLVEIFSGATEGAVELLFVAEVVSVLAGEAAAVRFVTTAELVTLGVAASDAGSRRTRASAIDPERGEILIFMASFQVAPGANR